MKKHRILISLTLALVLLCGTALAANTIKTQMIEANYMGIRVVIDGLEVTPKDATGHTVEPFTSNGTTYLPVRAVAEALGKDVEWDGENRIVYIGDNIPGKETNWMTKLPPYLVVYGERYDGSDRQSCFYVAGQTQTQGVTLTSGKRPGWEIKDASALWNTDNKYKTMNITIGHMSADMTSANLDVYLDGVYSTTYELPWDGAPKTISIPLNYAPNVKLELDTDYKVDPENPTSGTWYSTQYSTTYGIYNISFSE